MTQADFQVPLALDYFATFLWALSGAAVGMHKRYDFAGVLVVALLSSTGGSLIRDGIFLQQMPPVLGNSWYIPIILLATVVVSLFRQRITRMPFVDQLI
ncbi:MAG TPA: TRIC cation channel family protein, partial [Caldilineaceae bacterium]|nr:TRIC cation channel family protein [Caldilineaceae bacterium]